MKVKKTVALGLTLALATTLAGCQSTEKTPAGTTAAPAAAEATTAAVTAAPTEAKKSDVKLTFMTNVVGEQATALEAAVKGFMEETGYEVEFSAPGKSYEELMKTKMSSKELPDVFTTHGWSVARYSEYLMPVNDLSFAKDIKDQIKPIITDADGNMFVLPMDVDVAGIVYNVDVLEEAGVNVDDLKTWDDFSAACESIKNAGKIPVHMGGKDNWTIGQYFDWAAPSFYVTNDAANQREALKNGTFDKAVWEQVAGMMEEWVKKGYFNEDALTADYNADMKALAENRAAFCFYGNSAMMDVHTLNPDAKLGMMPIPAASADDEPSLIAGERIAVGVWNDSPQKDAAVELLEYLARPEVMSKVATASGNPAGLNGVESEIGEISAYYDKYSSVETFPYFDREYLPSGMWDVMCATGADILAGKGDAVKTAASVMEQNFNDKFVQ